MLGELQGMLPCSQTLGNYQVPGNKATRNVPAVLTYSVCTYNCSLVPGPFLPAVFDCVCSTEYVNMKGYLISNMTSSRHRVGGWGGGGSDLNVDPLHPNSKQY